MLLNRRTFNIYTFTLFCVFFFCSLKRLCDLQVQQNESKIVVGNTRENTECEKKKKKNPGQIYEVYTYYGIIAHELKQQQNKTKSTTISVNVEYTENEHH